MKLKSLAVITLLVLGCSFASAQTFGFASVGSGLYCNYEQLYVGGFVVGVDNLSACGFSYNSNILGFAGTISPEVRVVHGAGVLYGDDIYALEGDPTEQYQVFSALKCNKKNPKTGKFKGSYSWIGIAAVSGVLLGENYGYLSCTIPSPTDGDALMRGTTVSKMPRPQR